MGTVTVDLGVIAGKVSNLGTAAFEPTSAFATAADLESIAEVADSAVQSVVPGTNVTVDDTDPQNPKVSAAGGGGTSFDPASLFGASDDGVFFDPSDITTLFQDTAGTVPVTAAGQSVKCMLDKSGKGHSATQATAPPTYQVDEGGTGYLSFNGSQYLDCGTGMNADFFAGCVGYQANAANQRVLDTRGTGAVPSVIGWYLKASNPSGSDGFALDDGTAFISSNYTIPIGVPHALYFAHVASASLSYALDANLPLTVVSGSTLGSVKSAKTSRIGAASNDASQGLNGRFYGVLVVHRALTRTEIQNLRHWQIGKTAYF